ncbi:MAG: hypothetical protein ACAH88_09870 [Roseimicrobium sp.]
MPCHTLFQKAADAKALLHRRKSTWSGFVMLMAMVMAGLLTLPSATAETLHAGAARVEITDKMVGTVNDPLYAKALVLKKGGTTVVLITIDAVSIGEIGRIGNGFLATVRSELQKDLGVPPESVVINASHCHGVVRADTAALTVQAVKDAWQKATPARAAAGEG